MTACNLRAALTAFLLGTASIGAAAIVTTIPAQAAVSKAVGLAINEARNLAEAKNYKAAMAKVNEAGAAAKTTEENNVVNQMKQYIAVKSGDASIGGALGAKAKFANDAAAGKWRDVIADGDLLRKNNALDTQSQVVIAQAYLRQGDKQGCISYIKRNFGNGGGENVLLTLQKCAYDANDDETQRQALEALVATTGKPEYWSNLLKLSERSRGMNDHATLDIYRLKQMTGSLNGADDYTLLAQLGLQMGFAAEAQATLQKGIDSKVIPASDRTNRLMNLAKTQAAANAAGQAKALAAAQAAPQGDALVKIGEDQIGQGKAKDAIATIQAGLAKPMKDKNNGQIRLGQAYLAAGQKDAAIKAFGAVKAADDKDKSPMIAHLWSLAARR